MTDCVFCNIPKERILRETADWYVIRDLYPVSPGHTLFIPKLHITDQWDLSTGAWFYLQFLLRDMKKELDKEYSPDGYNIGINNGAAAGQTVFHLHVHMIPRYKGDVEDPRGGVRYVIPDKVRYW
jgi:diadenosine tetraphosphate (Ap4A) HIT family hydrolase